MAEDPPPRFLPESIRSLDIPQSGWDRVRQLYQRNEYDEYPEEVDVLAKGAFTGMLFGLVYGGLPAAYFSRQQYIKNSQAELYQHRGEAVRAAHNAAVRGFIRYGCRWGWRIAAFVTIFNSVTIGLSAYQDKIAASHSVAAGAVCGGLFRLNLGLRGLVGGSIIGAILGLPAGLLLSGMQYLSGVDLHAQKRQLQRQRYEEKIQEWDQQLQEIDLVMEQIQSADAKSSECDMEKIKELLHQSKDTEQSPEK